MSIFKKINCTSNRTIAKIFGGMTGDSDLRVKEVIVDSRINKVLAMRTDSVPMLEALDAISEFYVSSKECSLIVYYLIP